LGQIIADKTDDDFLTFSALSQLMFDLGLATDGVLLERSPLRRSKGFWADFAPTIGVLSRSPAKLQQQQLVHEILFFN
jgi:hypothetical protein